MSNLSRPIEGDERSAASQDTSQKDESGPEAGTYLAKVPGSDPPENDADKETKNAYDWWRNAFALGALLISLVALGVSIASWLTAEKTFRATHRGAVYLGLPDGKVGQVISSVKGPYMLLYFRNYGSAPAQGVRIEVWPIVNLPGPSVGTAVIPSPETRYFGPTLPPGFPVTIPQSIPGTTKEELGLRKKYLRVLGRIRYVDDFNEYCEPFSVAYDAVAENFVPLTSLTPRLCYPWEEAVHAKVEVTEDGRVGVHIGPANEQ